MNDVVITQYKNVPYEIKDNSINKVPTSFCSREKFRTIDDLSIEVINKYSNIVNVLNAEKEILSYKRYYTFSKQQLYNITINPINILYETIELMKEKVIYIGGKSLIEYALILYDPDATYDGVDFVDLVVNLQYKYIKIKNSFDGFDLYTKYKRYSYNLSSKYNKISRSAYGIIKVLVYISKISLKNLYNIFLNHLSIYTYKLYLFILNKEFNNHSIGIEYVSVIKGNTFPFAIYKYPDYTIKRTLKRKKIKSYSEEYKINTDFILKYKHIINDIENSLVSTNITDINYLIYIKNKNILDANESKDTSIEKKNIAEVLSIYKSFLTNRNKILKILEKTIDTEFSNNHVSYILGLFLMAKDYTSFNNVVDLGISINSYYVDNDLMYKRMFLLNDSFKGLKYMYNKNVKLDSGIVNNVTTFKYKYEVIPAFIWLIQVKHIKLTTNNVDLKQLLNDISNLK